MSAKRIDIGACFSLGWAKTKAHLAFFILLVVCYFLVEVGAGLVSVVVSGRGMMPLAASWLLSLFVGGMLYLGITKISLNLHDGKEARLGDLFSCMYLVPSYIGAAFLYTLIAIAGFLLLIIPGLIWTIQFLLFIYFIVDEEMGPVAALKASSATTYGAKWQLCWLLSLLVLLNLAGALLLLVGLFVTIPMSLMAMACAFRQLQGEPEPPGQTAAVDARAAA